MTTKKGSKFGKFMLNDYSGHMEIVFWEDNYVKYGNYLVNGQKLMITGSYQEHKYRPGVMEFMIQGITLLDNVRKTLTKKLHVKVSLQRLDEQLAAFIETNVKTHPGNTEMILTVVDENSDMVSKLKTHNNKLEVNDDMIQYLNDSGVLYSVEVM